LHNNIIETYVKGLGYNNIMILHPTDELNIMVSLYASREEWVDKNIFIYGDIIFSRKAIKKIINSDNKLSFFIRIKPHLYLNKRYNEQFAMLIPKNEIERISNIIVNSYEGSKKVDQGGEYILKKIYSEFGITLYNEYLGFKSHKTRNLISKLCLNDIMRNVFYSMIRPFEGMLIRFIFYRAKLTTRWRNKLIKLFLGKEVPDYNKNISLSTEYVVEIHDITDDIDSPREYKDYIKKIVKKGLLK